MVCLLLYLASLKFTQWPFVLSESLGVLGVALGTVREVSRITVNIPFDGGNKGDLNRTLKGTES